MRTNGSLVAVCAAIALGLCGTQALSQSGGSGGGGGGGGTITTTTTTATMNNMGRLFHGVLPGGQTTYTYSKDGSVKKLTIQLYNIDVADGDMVDIELDEAMRVANWIAHTYTTVHIPIYQGMGAVSWSSAKGDVVPFLLPTVGTTSMTIWGDFTDYPGTDALESGTWIETLAFGALTRG